MAEKDKHPLEGGRRPLRPSGQVRTLKIGDRVELRREWFSFYSVPLFAFALVWSGGRLLTIMQSIRGEFAPGRGMGLMEGIAFGVAATGLLYYALASVFNTTRVWVQKDALHVRTLPFPLRLPAHIDVGRILAVDVVDSGARFRGFNGPITFNLNVYTDDGDRRTLFHGLNVRSDGLFLKQELEFILGLDHDEDVERKAKG
ncbi:MAG: hypothetical protein AAFV33_27770 [Chloroflexota bacterium]